MKSEKSEEYYDSHEFPQIKRKEKYEDFFKKPKISIDHKKYEKNSDFSEKYLSSKKESKEIDKISSKGRKIKLRSKEFPVKKKDLLKRSSSEESEPNSFSKLQEKRKRQEYRDSSEESNRGYKKKIIRRSDSENKDLSLSDVSSGHKTKEKGGKKTKIIGKQEEKPMKFIGREQEKTIKRFIEKPIKFIGKEQEKTIDKFNAIVPKEKGNFIYGDKAKKIVSAKTEGDEILCQIQWMERKNGTVPKISYLTNTIIKEYDPLILANFYETKILKTKKQRKIFFDEIQLIIFIFFLSQKS